MSSAKKMKELSKGMRVKLSLATALSHNPKRIILDEPTAGLDPVVRRDVLELLRRVTAEDPGKSVIISSHITDDIKRIADSVTYLIEGKISLSDEKDELLANWKKIHYRAGALSDKAAETLVTLMFLVFCVLMCAVVFDSELLLSMLVFGNPMNVEKYEEKHNAY